jgi:hypothetical protein
MQNKRMNITAIDPQQTHALRPDGTYGDPSHKNIALQFAAGCRTSGFIFHNLRMNPLQ